MIDYTLVISIIALIISGFSLLGNKRISSLEKRTEIMAEIGSIEILINKSYREYNLSQKLKTTLSTELVSSLEDINISLNNVQTSLEEVYVLVGNGNISIFELEKVRPNIQKIMRDAQKILDNIIEEKNNLYQSLKNI